MENLQNLMRALRARCPGLSLKENAPMAEYCSFRIGGPCAVMILPSSAEELTAACAVLREAGEAPLIIGNGTNLLVTDDFLPRAVLKVGEGLSTVEGRGETRLLCGCGISLTKLAMKALEASLAGLEFAHGIPGTLGGAVCMNAGAYGGEMRDTVRRVWWLDRNLVLRETQDAGFSYRRSRFSDTDDILLAVELELSEGEGTAIGERMRELMDRRRASQPLDMPSAGSTFKRPPGHYAAALIEQAGLKGVRHGGAMVSPKHAGFLVNTGGATCEDVLRLMEYVQNEVLRQFGVSLEPEVKFIR